MRLWKVRMTSLAEEELKGLLAAKKVTKADIKVLLRWLDEMEEYGQIISQSPKSGMIMS